VEPAAPRAGSSGPALERLFELTSVVPLAGFALLHCVTYGRAAWGASEVGYRHAPSAFALAGEAIGIWLPLGFHVLYAWPLWQRRRRVAAPERERAWLALHRLAGALLGLFLCDHFVRFRWPILVGDRYPADSLTVLAAELSQTTAGFPLVAALHALGTLALAFHLGYGLWRVVERRVRADRRRPAGAACAALGGLVAVIGTLAVVRLATG
jgi:succinate dehydrogenase/fumarate reductase cytochrome b subunit